MSYPTGPVGPPPQQPPALPPSPWAAGPVPPPQAWPAQVPPHGPPGQMPPYSPAGQMPPYGPPGQMPYAPPGQVPYGQPWQGVPPQPAVAPRVGRPPAWPLRVWRSWSETRRAFAAIAVAAVAAGGLYGLTKVIDAYDAKHPDYVYSMLDCSGANGKVTVDFTLTSRMSVAQDAQVDVEYFDRAGKQLGDDWIDVPGIKPGQTIRKSHIAKLAAASEVSTCKFDHDVISRDPHW